MEHGNFFVDTPDDFAMVGNGTVLRASPSGVGGFSSQNAGILLARKTQTTGSITSGTNTLTVADATNFAVGKLVVILGAAGGESRQRTTIADGGDGIDATQTTIGVASTSGSGGSYLKIDNEIVSYTGTSGGNTFTGVTRGVFGTTAASHAEGANVDTVPYFWTEITNVSGTTITLLDNASFTVSSATVIVGSKNIKLLGDITIDGNQNRGGAAPANNLMGLDAKFARYVYVAPTVKFTNISHAGIYAVNGRDNNFEGIFHANGRPADGLGFDVILFGRNLRTRVRTVSHYDTYIAVALDDRGGNYQSSDGPAERNRVELGDLSNIRVPFTILGGNDNAAYLGHVPASVLGVQISAGEWTSNPTPTRNTVYFGSINSSATAIDLGAAAAGGQNFIFGGRAVGTVSRASGNSISYIDSVGDRIHYGGFLVLDTPAATALSLRFQDNGTTEWDIGKNASNNFFVTDAGVGTRLVFTGGSHSTFYTGSNSSGVRFDFRRLDGTIGFALDPVAVRQYFGTTSTDTYLERVTAQHLRTDSRLEVDGKLQVDSGVDANGGGFKHVRVSTGSVAASGSAAVTVTWTTAFADANYTPVCSVQEATAGSNSLRVHHVQSIAAGSIVVRVVNDNTGSALTGTLLCQAVHD